MILNVKFEEKFKIQYFKSIRTVYLRFCQSFRKI